MRVSSFQLQYTLAFALTACLASDFDRAEQREHERETRTLGAGGASGQGSGGESAGVGGAGGAAGALEEVRTAAAGTGGAAGNGGSGSGAGAGAGACPPGYADCAAADGCETQVSVDVENCGTCDARCEAKQGSVATCEDAACHTVRISIDGLASATPEPHGAMDRGAAFDHTCPVDHALVGIAVIGDSDAIYGLGALCNPQLLTRAEDGKWSIIDGEPYNPDPVGYEVENPSSNLRLREVICPDGSVVKHLSGSTWQTETGDPILKSLELSCVALAVDGEGQLVFGAESTLTAGVQNPDLAFVDDCPAGEISGGFSGLATREYAVDALQTWCAPLTIVRK